MRSVLQLSEKQEVALAGRSAFKSEKRRKELIRAKKQEEKRQQRFDRSRGAHKEPEEGEETQAARDGEGEA